MSVSNYDKFIDSRDAIARIDELSEAATLGEEDLMELEALQELAHQAEQCGADWHYGTTLIRDSYFKEYAQELAEDTGAINPYAAWPANCIDWDEAAEQLQVDYMSVEFDGVTYWVR